MTYATQTDLIARFGEQTLIDLTDRADPPMGAIDAAVLDGASAAADAEIDGYLAVRYTVPVDPVPARLTDVACELVFYRLNVHRLDDASPVLRRYRDAVAWLREVAAGRAVLVGAVAPATQPPAGGMAEVVQAGRKVFGGGLG